MTRMVLFRIWRTTLPFFFFFFLLHFLKDITQDILHVSSLLDLMGDIREDVSGFPEWVRVTYYIMAYVSILGEAFIVWAIVRVWRGKAGKLTERFLFWAIVFLFAAFGMFLLADPSFWILIQSFL